jgi:acylphosphatase
MCGTDQSLTGEDRMLVCKRCVVAGRVQGVYYRATAARRAHELALRGHARNLPDGRVEVVVCGEAGAVETYVSWLWIGSSAAKVTSVEVAELALRPEEVPDGFQTF